MATLVEGTNNLGGYLVPDQNSPVDKYFYEYGLARKLIKKYEATGKTVNVHTGDNSGVQAYIIGEAASATKTNPTYARATLTIDKLVAAITMSQEFREDVTLTDLPDSILEDMIAAMAKLEDEVVFKVGGATSSNSTSIPDAVATGQTLDLKGKWLTPDYILDAIRKLKDNGSKIGNLVMVAGGKIVDRLMKLKDDNGMPLLNQVTYGSPLYKKDLVGYIHNIPVYDTKIYEDYTYNDGATDYTVESAVIFDVTKARLYVRKALEYEWDRTADTDTWTVYLRERMGFIVTFDKAVVYIKDALVGDTESNETPTWA